MPSHIVAYGQGASVLGKSVYVVIRKQTSGTDQSTQFHLSPDCFTLTTTAPSDSQLLPGINPRDIAVTTIWDDTTALESLLSDIASSSDGKFFIELYDNLSITIPLHCFVLLPESLTIAEEDTAVLVTFRGTDGLALLKNTPYNNNGNPYTDHASVLQHIKNVQSKLMTWPRIVEGLFSLSGAFTRVAVQENAVSVDDQFYVSHPPATEGYNVERVRVHHRTFHKQNADGVNEYYSCWDVLQSLCLTFGWSCYMRQGALYLINRQNGEYDNNTAIFKYDGTKTYLSNSNFYPFNGTQGGVINVKSGNWSRTYAMPSGDVYLTRLTQGSQGVIYSTDDASGTTLYDTDEWYDAGEELTIRGSIRVIKDADTSFSSGAARLWRYVPSFQVRAGMDGDTNYYLNTILTASQTANMTAVLNENTEFQNTVNYHHLNTPNISGTASIYEWNTNGTSTYKYRTPMADGRFWFLHDAATDIDVVIPFEFTFKMTALGGTKIQGLEITPRLTPYDWQGQPDTTHFDDATVNFIEVGVYRRDKDQLQQKDSFQYKATTTSGRARIDLGETLLGDRGASTYYGGIEVYDGSAWIPSSGWVNMDQSTARTINQMAVEEVGAHHKTARQLQRGVLITTVTAPNFQVYDDDVRYLYKDMVSSVYYAPLSYSFNFGSATTEITLFKVSRDFTGITVQVEDSKTNPTSNYVKPNGTDAISPAFQIDNDTNAATQSYHNRAELIGSNWNPSYVIDGATLEYYYTVNVDGIGIWANHQGEVPAVGFNIQRKVYIVDEALANAASSGWSSPSAAQPAPNDTLAETLENVQKYIGKLTNAAATYTILVAYEEISPFTGILDTYTTASAAYSTRRLSSTYTGSLLRVRRSDGTEQDIGYTADGDLDESAIITFASGTACTVSVWYDQSSNGNDINNTTVTAQPEIYTGSVFYTIGAGTPTRKALSFSSDYLQGTADLHAGAFYAAAAVVTGSSIGNLSILNQDDSLAGGTARIGQYLRTGSANNTARCVVFNTSGTATSDNTANNTVSANTAYVISSHGKSNQVEAFVGDVSNGHTSVTGPLRHGSGLYRVGANAHTTTPGALWNGRIAEIILFDEDMSSGHQTGVVTDIETYFTI